MPTDLQARAAMLQAVLTAVIAVSTGWWAYNTNREQLLRVEEQQAREQRDAQNEAISQMSRQLGLMEAQCEREQLRIILDQPSPKRRQKRCYDAYIGARSLFFLSKVRIIRGTKVSEKEWERLWKKLLESLGNAGNISYDSAAVSEKWKAIVEKSRQP